MTRHIRALPSRPSRWEMGHAGAYSIQSFFLRHVAHVTSFSARGTTPPRRCSCSDSPVLALRRRRGYGRTLRDSPPLWPPYRPSRVRSRPRPPPWRSAYTHGDPIDLGQRQPPSTLGGGLGTPRRWMYRDKGCDLAARSPPPRVGRTSCFEEGGRTEGTTGVCAADDERYAAGASREGVQVGRGGSANATGMGARHGRAVWRGRQGDSRHGKSMYTLTHPDVDADVVCLPLRRTDACAPFSCLLPPVRLSGSGCLPVASTAPTQRPHTLPPLYPLLAWTRVAQSLSPIRTPVAPCPRSAIRYEVCMSMYSSVDESF
jgi:hypothetical protein